MRIVTLVVFIACLSAWSSVWASVAVRLSFADIVQRSDRVASVVLESSESYWGPQNRRIFTRFSFRVVEDIAGQGPSQISLVQPGGQQDGLMQVSHGYPSFRKNTPQVVFLKDTRAGYVVVGLCQGVFDLNDAVAGPKLVQQQIPTLRLVPAGDRIVMDRAKASAIIRQRFASRSLP